ncbi:MAG: UTP--glucose-1-phosphate uridylyltransferase GalU [Candidatus Improbicoccus pseudotrichonymphae]|uniref:UTP--glucose-1-phosphate uridylyltransferase n=1 Tax=Candidatus Improbicoccus pseudotrichonymphae TaxID=3033792 RepID=A0AA48KX28_9FIRM|nr:MAG: UTP--glucose-1-phosphate uridylyltransferase GalU [Candidatus Improbicoccus pseudotrichonymphae]
MARKITKAVIPAAGFGTRMLPASKVLPKEMFPIVNKPAIHYIVDEIVLSGITDILIITSRGKKIIEDYFDRTPELENYLEKRGQYEELKTIKEISEMANIHFLRQREIKGLGHAVGCAKSFVKNEEAFVVVYPDDLIMSKIPACKTLMEIYEEFSLSTVGIQKVPLEEISKYGSVNIEKIRGNIFRCDNMIEKPSPDQVLSPYAIFGRCVLQPEIFDVIDNILPGAGNEIQLTDAMKVIAQKNGMIAVNFDDIRFDLGCKFGLINAANYLSEKNY